MLDKRRQELRGQIGVPLVEPAVVRLGQHEGLGTNRTPVDLVDLANALRLREQEFVLANVGNEVRKDRLQQRVVVRCDRAVDDSLSKELEFESAVSAPRERMERLTCVL